MIKGGGILIRIAFASQLVLGHSPTVGTRQYDGARRREKQGKWGGRADSLDEQNVP